MDILSYTFRYVGQTFRHKIPFYVIYIDSGNIAVRNNICINIFFFFWFCSSLRRKRRNTILLRCTLYLHTYVPACLIHYTALLVLYAIKKKKRRKKYRKKYVYIVIKLYGKRYGVHVIPVVRVQGGGGPRGWEGRRWRAVDFRAPRTPRPGPRHFQTVTSIKSVTIIFFFAYTDNRAWCTFESVLTIIARCLYSFFMFPNRFINCTQFSVFVPFIRIITEQRRTEIWTIFQLHCSIAQQCFR